MTRIPSVVISTGRRAATALVLALLVLAAGPQGRALADGEPPEAFLDRFAQEGLEILTDTTSDEAQRQDKIRGLLTRYFDLPRAGRITLGRHWRRATEEERAEYGLLFKDYVVVSISRRMEGFAPDTLEIIGARTINDAETVVETRIDNPGSGAVRVNWSLVKTVESWRVLDVAIEGVSQVLTQRNEFDAVIRAGGGMAALLERLREQTAALSASPS